MPKKFFFLIFIFFLFFLYSLISPISVFAVSCSDKAIGIDYSPKRSLENASDYNLTFTMSEGTKNFLNKDNKFIRYRTNMFGADWATEPIPVTNNTTFQITIPKYPQNGFLFESGEKSGKLEWSQTGNQNDFQELCSDINFKVGITNTEECFIDPPLSEKLQPKTSIDIRFIGRANKEYTIWSYGLLGNNLGKISTDSEGQGRFKNIIIDGSPGETKNIKISASSGNTGSSCGGSITIDLNAPTPVKPPQGPIDPALISTNKIKLRAFTGEVKKSAGIPCPGGIETAIGCIPTDPTEFVKGFLKFSVAIAGGVALLIMVFGAFKMITSAGNPETLKEGHELFTNAIIGLLFIIFSTLLLKIIGVDILGLGKFLGI